MPITGRPLNVTQRHTNPLKMDSDPDAFDIDDYDDYVDYDEYNGYCHDSDDDVLLQYHQIFRENELSEAERNRQMQLEESLLRNVEVARNCKLEVSCQNHNGLQMAISKYFNIKRNSDLILLVGNRTFLVHRLILSAWSDVFKTMFCDPTWKSQSQATRECSLARQKAIRQELVEEESCAQVFGDFLKFMYTSQVALSKDNVLPLAKLADKYLVDELRLLCVTFINDTKDLPATIYILQTASRLAMREIIKCCRQILLANFNRLTKRNLLTRNNLLRIDTENMMALLDSGPSLVIDDEFCLFTKLQPWLERCRDDTVFLRILKLLRFHYMSASQLKKISSSVVFSRAESLYPGFLLEVWQLQTLFAESFTDDLPANLPWPRLYLQPGKERATSAKFRENGKYVGNISLSDFIEVEIERQSMCRKRFSPWVGDKKGECLIFKRQPQSSEVIVSATFCSESRREIDIKLSSNAWCQHNCHVAVEVTAVGQRTQYLSKYLEKANSITDEDGAANLCNRMGSKTIDFKIASSCPFPNILKLRIAAVVTKADVDTPSEAGY